MRFPLFVFSQRFPKTSHGMRREVYYERRKYDKEDYNDDDCCCSDGLCSSGNDLYRNC